MYSRRSSSPGWLIVCTAIFLVFGLYFVWRGIMAWVASSGGIVVVTPTLSEANVGRTATVNAIFGTVVVTEVTPITATPSRVCQDFRVKVQKARIRDCPKDTCNTISLPGQGASICVYGVAPDAPDWYEIDVNPSDPASDIGYMSRSVLSPAHPTPTSSATLNLSTVTPVPSRTPTITSTAPPTNTPNPLVLPPATPVPSKTPTEILQTA